MSVAISDQFDVRDGRYPGLDRPSGGNMARAFGGHMAGLMLAAAYQTAPAAMSIQHLHVEFLKPGRVGEQVLFDVAAIGDGRTMIRRRIELRHPDGPPLAEMLATFAVPKPTALSFQIPMPDVGQPEDFPLERSEPVEIRRREAAGDASRQRTWLRPTVRPLSPLRTLQDCSLLYISDFTILWPTLAVHGVDAPTHRHQALGTVSHTMYFHRPASVGEWMLYDQRTPTTSAGLGHAEGRLYSVDGVLVASVIQVGLLRPVEGSGRSDSAESASQHAAAGRR